MQFFYSIKKMLSKIKASFTPERNYAFYSRLSPKKYEKEQRRAFKIVFGKKLTRENVKTFNEKIQWLRCYDNTPIKTILADKYRVRDYVKKQVGEKYLIKLLGVWNNFDEIDFSKLPYLLEVRPGNGKQKGGTNKKDADIFKADAEVNPENEDISGQTKPNQNKLSSEEEETSNASFEIPGYAYNQTTHNVTGLLESLERHKVTDLKEKQAIMKLSDYGRKGTQIWRLFSNTTWGKIGAPGKYIIAALTNKQK